MRQAVQTEYVAQLLDLAGQADATVSGLARQRLEAIADNATSARHTNPNAAHRLWLARTIEAGLEQIDRGERPEIADTPVPPGSPIGADSCWHCDSAARLGLSQ